MTRARRAGRGSAASASAGNLEGEHRSEAGHLTQCAVVSWVAGETRIAHAFDGGVTGKTLGEAARSLDCERSMRRARVRRPRTGHDTPSTGPGTTAVEVGRP